MECNVNFFGTTRRDDAMVGHDTVIVIKYKKIVKAAKRALQQLCHTKVKVAFFGINKYLCDQGRSGCSA